MGLLIALTVAAIATPMQMGVGDARRAGVRQPADKFAAIEMVDHTSTDVPETLFGHLNSNYQVVGGIPIPGLASILSDRNTGTHGGPGPEHGPDRRPADRPDVNVHLAFDVMVGLGTALIPLSLWSWVVWIFRRDIPQSRWFLRAARLGGIPSIVTLEAGWTVSEVGRQPWIVYHYMKVDDAPPPTAGSGSRSRSSSCSTLCSAPPRS